MPLRSGPLSLLLVSTSLACTSATPPPDPRPTQAPAEATPTANAGASADPDPAAPIAPKAVQDAPAGEHAVLAKIVDAGPIGDGRCSQRSYQIEVVELLAGAPLESPSWVHFERCQGDTGPIVEGSGLKVGERYRLRLRDGASENFGAAPMIVAIDPP